MDHLWKGTREVPVVRVLEHEEKRLRQAAGEADEGVAVLLREKADDVAKEIAKRKADRRWWITVRHIGSPSSPLQWNEMTARYTSALHDVEKRARQALLKEHGSPEAAALAEGASTFAAAVAASTERSTERMKAVIDHAKACVEEGTIGGAETVQRLLQVGKVGLLIHALEEVRAYQEVDPEMGEG